MTNSPQPNNPQTPLGLIAGRGLLPEYIIHHCLDTGRPIFVIAVEGYEHELPLSHVPHVVLSIGMAGKAIKTLQEQQITDIIFAGQIKRPSLKKIKLDMTGAKILAKLMVSSHVGDNKLLSHILGYLEGIGFNIKGISDVLSSLIIKEELLTKTKPDKQAKIDIELGRKIATAIGPLDIGQSIATQQATVIGVEAIEGTDDLIIRCGSIKLPGEKPVLVKMKKPNQDTRIDLPTIGPETITNLGQAGFKGIAIEAGSAIILDRQTVIEEANQLGLFIIGI